MRKSLIYLIINDVLSLPPHEEIYYSEDEIPHPLTMGFQKANGEPQGQRVDYRFILKDGRSIHAKDYGKYFGFHWDWVDPRKNWIEHLRRDSPFWYTALCGLGGAGLGALATAPSKKKDVILKSSIICGFIGLFIGLATAEWE